MNLKVNGIRRSSGATKPLNHFRRGRDKGEFGERSFGQRVVKVVGDEGLAWMTEYQWLCIASLACALYQIAGCPS